MIKAYHEITLRDYDTMERIGRISQLKKWYNPFPVILFAKQIKNQLEKLSELLNNKDNDREFEREIWKTESMLKINLLQANYYGVVNILKLQTQTAIFSVGHKKLNIKLKDKNLQKYIERIKDLTGIEIKTLENIESVYKKLQLMIDRFNANFAESKPKDEKVYLMDVAIGMFSYLNQTVNPKEHTVMDFISIREIAIEQSRKLKEKYA